MCGCAEHAKDGGVLPTTGFPQDGGMATRKDVHEANGHGANIRFISDNMHSYTGGRLVIIPLKRTFRGGRVRSGSSGTRGGSRT